MGLQPTLGSPFSILCATMDAIPSLFTSPVHGALLSPLLRRCWMNMAGTFSAWFLLLCIWWWAVLLWGLTSGPLSLSRLSFQSAPQQPSAFFRILWKISYYGSITVHGKDPMGLRHVSIVLLEIKIFKNCVFMVRNMNTVDSTNEQVSYNWRWTYLLIFYVWNKQHRALQLSSIPVSPVLPEPQDSLHCFHTVRENTG